MNENIGEDIILGMDYLLSSPITKNHTMSLMNALNEGSNTAMDIERSNKLHLVDSFV